MFIPYNMIPMITSMERDHAAPNVNSAQVERPPTPPAPQEIPAQMPQEEGRKDSGGFFFFFLNRKDLKTA